MGPAMARGLTLSRGTRRACVSVLYIIGPGVVGDRGLVISNVFNKTPAHTRRLSPTPTVVQPRQSTGTAWATRILNRLPNLLYRGPRTVIE